MTAWAQPASREFEPFRSIFYHWSDVDQSSCREHCQARAPRRDARGLPRTGVGNPRGTRMRQLRAIATARRSMRTHAGRAVALAGAPRRTHAHPAFHDCDASARSSRNRGTGPDLHRGAISLSRTSSLRASKTNLPERASTWSSFRQWRAARQHAFGGRTALLRE